MPSAVCGPRPCPTRDDRCVSSCATFFSFLHLAFWRSRSLAAAGRRPRRRAPRPGRGGHTAHRESFTRNAELPESPRAPAAPAVCLSCDTGHEPHRTVYNTGATLRFITGTAVTVRPYDRGLTPVSRLSCVVQGAGRCALNQWAASNPRVGVDRDQLDLVQQARIRWHAALR